MTPTSAKTRAAWERGWIEFRRGFTKPSDGGFYVVMGVVIFFVLWNSRDQQVEGSTLTYSAIALPSIVGGLIAFLSIMGIGYALATEREDGTLLRMRSLPGGVSAYFLAQLLRTTLETVSGIVIAVAPALIFIDGVFVGDLLGLLWLPPIIVLGLFASLPIGVIIGAVARSAKSVNTWGGLPLFFVIWVSGIFVPTIALPQWAHVVAQTFPIYWMGLGTRAALLPDEAAALEIGGVWRPGLTVAVLLAWAVVGALIAVPVLRRAAQRESGSAVAERRERALRRS